MKKKRSDKYEKYNKPLVIHMPDAKLKSRIAKLAKKNRLATSTFVRHMIEDACNLDDANTAGAVETQQEGNA